MPNVLKILAVLVIVATVVIAVFALSGREEKAFNLERAQMERVLKDQMGGKNPFTDSALSKTLPAKKTRKIAPVSVKDNSTQVWIKTFRIDFAGSGYRQTADNRLENGKFILVVKQSILNKVLAYSASKNPFAVGTLGANVVENYARNTKPFSRLRDIYRATVERIDSSEAKVASRYKALYLYSLKAQLLPPSAKYGFEEFKAPAGRGFIAGDISKGNNIVQAIICHGKTGYFFKLLFKGKKDAAMKDVYDVLGGMRITKDG